jgi:hypothetical protein
MKLGDRSDQRQAEAAAAALSRRVAAVQALEYSLLLIGRDARTVIADLEERRAVVGLHGNFILPAECIYGVLAEIEDQANSRDW